MEWHIMNVGGVSSLGSNLGCLEDSQYIPSDECKGKQRWGGVGDSQYIPSDECKGKQRWGGVGDL